MAGHFNRSLSAWRIVAPYCLFTSAWILLSDRFVAAVVPDVQSFSYFSTIKGLVFVAISGGLLYLLLRSEHEAIHRAEHQRDDLLASEQAARARAESANRAKDELLAIVSHELRTPLTPILALTEALRQDPLLSSEAAEQLDRIRESVVAECRIVDDLLDSTRMAAGKLDFSLVPLDLRTVVGRAVRDATPLAGARGVTLGYAAGGEAVLVMGDGGRLGQVFRNLLDNAIKFTRAGGNVTVRISTTVDGQKPEALVEIQDSGIGIRAEVLPRLFAPFEQADRSTTRRFGGLGLGLYLARNLIEMHRGELFARSDGEAKGATFCVRLSLCQATPAPVCVPAQLKSVVPRTPLELSVLLVDDNVDTLRAFGRILKTMGCEVVPASNAQEAMAAAGSRRFDVLLSDIGLPDQSGWDLMRALHLKQGIPGIAVSGFGSEDDIRRSREAGFLTHLVKPVSFQDLRSVLDGVRTAKGSSAAV